MTVALLLLVPSAARAFPDVAFNGVVSTVATGNLSLSTPEGVAIDLYGNIYVSDEGNNRIIEITANGTAGILSISGLTTGLANPRGIALDASGNLYIADMGNARVVEVSPSGVGTVLNTSSVMLGQPWGVAVDTSGDVFISDTQDNDIVEITSGGSASILTITGLTPQVSGPRGIATDTYGNLYIADCGNNRIVEAAVGGAGSVVSTGGLTLSSPEGISSDNAGNLYIADTNNNRIVLVDPAGNSSVLLNGDASLSSPFAAAVSPMGAVYVADTDNNRVQSIEATSVAFGHVQLGGSSTSILLPFTVPSLWTISSINVYTQGTQNLDFTVANDSTCMAGTTNTSCTVDVAFTPAAAGLRNGALELVYTDTCETLTLTVPIFGIADAPVASLSPSVASALNAGTSSIGEPFQVAIDGVGNLYVTSFQNSTVTRIPAGGGAGTPVSTGSYTLSSPTGLAMDAIGDLFIADFLNNRIIEVANDGTASQLSLSGLSGGLALPTALAFDAAGNLYIDDYGHGRIVKMLPSGIGSVLSTGTYTLGNGNAAGFAVDSIGDVYIADQDNDRILKIDPFGNASVLSLAGAGSLSGPLGVAVDGSGNVFIMDSGNERVIQLTTSGVTSVVSFSGPTFGAFDYGISVDSSDNLILSDFSNNRLLKLNVSGTSFSFPDTDAGSASSTQVATVTNLGDQSLAMSANPGYTANFSEDTSDPNPCTSATSLTPGTSCDVPVAFTPQAVGNLSANIAVTDNALNGGGSTQTVSVSGTGLGGFMPTITWSQPGPILANTSLSGVLNATATYNGSDADGTFAYTATPQGGNASAVTGSTMLGAAQYTLTATFTPANPVLYQSATANVTLAVQDFGVSVSGGSSSQTATAGGMATFDLAFTPAGGSTFPDAVTLSVSGLPTGAAPTFTPASLPAGAGTTNITLGIQLAASTSAIRLDGTNVVMAAAWLPALLGLLLVPFGEKKHRLKGKQTLLVCGLLVASAAMGLVSCGGLSTASPATKSPSSQPQSYALTVTAASGSLSHTTTLNLTVQP